MLNRKKIYAEKAIEKELAALRANWGIENEDVSLDEEEKRELEELLDDLKLELAEASG